MALRTRCLRPSHPLSDLHNNLLDVLAPSMISRNGSPRNIPQSIQRSPFSASSILPSRRYKMRNGNFQRGVSPLRRTGLNGPLSVDKDPLPKAVLDPAKRSKIAVDEDHGLWEFFGEDKTALRKPEVVDAHGRSWTVTELRRKSWEDLHSLWWICAKERNRIATAKRERERLELSIGGYEDQKRSVTIRKTQAAIKHVLTERWYAWEDARSLAAEDPNIDLSGQGPAYMPYEAEEEEAYVPDSPQRVN